MFQDGSVKTILTRSHKPLRPQRHPARTGCRKTPCPRPLDHATPSGLQLCSSFADPPLSAPRRITLYRFRLNDFKSFDPLFKVLFIFPSQYLFAIGFPYIFSLRRSLSPTWCCSIKEHDSSSSHQLASDTTYGALTLFGGPFQDTSASDHLVAYSQITIRRPMTEITTLGFCRFSRPY